MSKKNYRHGNFNPNENEETEIHDLTKDEIRGKRDHKKKSRDNEKKDKKFNNWN